MSAPSLETLILHYLDSAPNGHTIPDTQTWMQQHPSCQQHRYTHEQLESTLKSLGGFGYVNLQQHTETVYELSVEGKEYCSSGSPEGQVMRCFQKSATLSAADLLSCLSGNSALFSIGTGQCIKNRWISFDKSAKCYSVSPSVDVANYVDRTQQYLQQIASGSAHELDAKEVLSVLRSRKMITMSTRKSYTVTKGPKFARERKAQATDLTVEMLKSGEWEHADFKQYELENILGADLRPGCLHPLMKVRAQFRSILLEMGFAEMPTNNFTESSFWNFDALFQPQQHPARDSHDTFFLTQPSTTRSLPEDYVSRVKEMHEKGGAGSIGYRYEWKLEEAQKNILRTHTTAVSSRMLYALAKQTPFQPTRLFSIDRVFRNETLDATHLAEFHQVEGLVADANLTLGDLLGTIKTFFQRIGISNVKFKPAYNPYTEPSMEIFGFSDELGKWIEIGNSGVFRPEMLTPMNLPENVKVIAWGLSLERPTMIKYGINNIRDLFGPKVKLEIIQRNPIARFDD